MDSGHPNPVEGVLDQEGSSGWVLVIGAAATGVGLTGRSGDQ